MKTTYRHDIARKLTWMFGVPFGLAFTLLHGWKSGLLAGVVGGAGFGIVFAWVLVSPRFRPHDPSLHKNEILRLATPGAISLGTVGRSVAGWLFLTNERAIFRPHRFSNAREDLVLPLGELDSSKLLQTSSLRTSGGRELKVEHPDAVRTVLAT